MWLWAIILCGYFIYDSLSVRISQTKLRLKSSTTKQEGVKVRLFINVHFSLRQNEINFPFRRAETAQIWSRSRDVSRKSYEKVEVLENLYFVKIHKKECFALSEGKMKSRRPTLLAVFLRILNLYPRWISPAHIIHKFSFCTPMKSIWNLRRLNLKTSTRSIRGWNTKNIPKDRFKLL